MSPGPARNAATPNPAAARGADRFDTLARQVAQGRQDGQLSHSRLSHSLGFLLRLASGVSQGRISARLEELDLRLSLYSVLLIIHENPGLRQQEVGRILSIQQPNLVSLINELVVRGLVQREVNAGDRRSYSLTLTREGEKLLAEADRLHNDNEQRLAAAIAPMKLSEFEAALKRILEI